MAIVEGWEIVMKTSSVRTNNKLILLSMNINTADMPGAGKPGCRAAHFSLGMTLARSWKGLYRE